MAGELKPYHSYKESGVPWLGEVPAHWTIQRAKGLFHKMERPAREQDEVVTCFRDGTVTLRMNRRVRGFTEALKEIGYQGIRRGDLVIHAMDAFAGAVGVSDSDGKGTPVYSVCQPTERANAYYYAFLIREMARSQWILALAKGIRERSTDFRYSDFAAQPVPLPPLDEQDSIVRYLDHVDRRIRRYIQAKQTLIKLLNEQKQAIIQQAVTRGLDPNVRMKSSGVEWLGDVPENWEVIDLRYLATKFGSGVTPRGGATVYVSSGIPFLRSQNIHFDGLRLEAVARIPPNLHQTLSATHVIPGDVLLNITGASIGRVCPVPDDFRDGNVNQHVCIIRPKVNRVLPDYLAAYLSTPYMQREIRFEQNGASREGLALDAIRAFKITVPPVAEQQCIMNSVHERTEQLAAAASASQSQIEVMREYRTRLIADVVTGKVDVREAASELPYVLGDEPMPDEIDTDVEDTQAEEMVEAELEADLEEAQA